MAELAKHCPGLSENVIENIENGRPDRHGHRRRDITVDEMMIIAKALDVQAGVLMPLEAHWSENELNEKAIMRSKAAIESLKKQVAREEADLELKVFNLEKSRRSLKWHQQYAETGKRPEWFTD